MSAASHSSLLGSFVEIALPGLGCSPSSSPQSHRTASAGAVPPVPVVTVGRLPGLLVPLPAGLNEPSVQAPGALLRGTSTGQPVLSGLRRGVQSWTAQSVSWGSTQVKCRFVQALSRGHLWGLGTEDPRSYSFS